MIDHLADLYPKWKDAKSLTEDHKKQIRKIIDNIVSTLPLDDLATARIFMQAFDKIIAIEGWQDVFSTDKITKLYFEKNYIAKLSYFRNLEEIKFARDVYDNIKFEEDMLSLKNLDLSNIVSLPQKGVERLHHLKNLEEIIFRNYHLPKLKFEGDLLNIKKLDLSKLTTSPQEGIEGLHHLKNLEEIVFGKRSFKLLKFDGDMLKIRKLDFSNAQTLYTVNIEGLHHLKNLEELSVGGTFLKLNFENDMPNLKKLDFSKARVIPKESIKGLNYLSSLKDLLFYTINDEGYNMVKNTVSLDNLSFLKSNIKIIKDLPEGLKTLSVQNCRNIEEIRLTEKHKNLVLDVTDTPITRHQIKGIEYLSEDNIKGLRD